MRVRSDRVRRIGALAVDALIIVIGGAAVAAVAFVALGGWSLRTVLSGSMEPSLPTGSVAIVQRQPAGSVDAGDVIVFHRPDRQAELVVHRVIERSPDGVLETQGDANDEPDPWRLTLRGEDAWVVRGHVPVVGWVVVAARGPWGRIVLFIAAGVLLIRAAMLVMGLRHRRGEPAPADL
jgi:signal peptidase I